MNEVMRIDQTVVCTSTSTSPSTAEETPSSPAGPMVFTVGQGSAPVLKLVSPVEGCAPQLIKVVPAVVSTSEGASQSEGKVSGGTVMVQKVEDCQQSDGVLSQRMYSIVQKPQIAVSAASSPAVVAVKSSYNNGQQRVHTLGALPPTTRVIPASATAATAQKVQILSNVVVSKQNIVLNKNALQAQRQVINSPLTLHKQLNNNNQKPSQPVAGKIQTINNILTATAQQKATLNNTVHTSQPQSLPPPPPKTTLKVVGGPLNRSATVQPQKTIKTLSPQGGGYVQKSPGIKTLSPQMNYRQLQNTANKIVPQSQGVQRVGIKTLPPQRAAINNKPNYIGKHASQAQRTPQKAASVATMKNRNVSAQRSSGASLSPLKCNNQKAGVGNTQSNFNQSLTAQILQSLPSTGSRTGADVSFSSTAKKFPLQSPSDETSLSEDIGEEVRPDFSPNLSYLYQVVMLDHNYGAPPPAQSPPPVMARSSSNQHHSPGVGGSALNGALSQGRDSGAASHYGASTAVKRGTHNRIPSTPLPSLECRGVVSSAAQMQGAHDDDAASTISSEGANPDDGDEGEETETAPEGEGDEDGITRCICDFDHDDGYMICCDVCSSWQHVDCMGLDRDHIPDKYSCVRCQPRRVDRQHARAIQQRKREEFARLGSVVVGSSSVTALGPTGSGGSGGNQSDSSSDTSTESEERAPVVSINNNLPKKRSAPVSSAGRRKSEPVRRAPLVQKRQQRRDSTAIASRRPVLKKREKKQVMKRKMKSRSSVDDSSQDSWPANYPNLGTSLLQLRQWIENYEEAVTNHYSPELRARITNMRANGQQQHQQQQHQQQHSERTAPSNAPQETQTQKCLLGQQPLTGIKIVVAAQALGKDIPVIELRGKYMLSTQHRTSSGSGGSGGLLTRQHSQRPGPFLFFYRLPRDGTEVCVDTRTYGNDARFIRRSCRPNAELRHLVEKGTLHLYIITTQPIDKNVELTLKHESHDLAAVAATPGSALVPCACGGSPATCGLYAQFRHNGAEPQEQDERQKESTDVSTITHRKRRGRRASSPRRTSPVPSSPPTSPLSSPTNHSSSGSAGAANVATITTTESSNTNYGMDNNIQTPPAMSTRRSSSLSHQTRSSAAAAAATVAAVAVVEISKERTSGGEPREKSKDRGTVDPREESVAPVATTATAKEVKDKKKKLTREERKMEAIMKAFERLEKAEQRKQEVQARQAQRRENDPPNNASTIGNSVGGGQGATTNATAVATIGNSKPENSGGNDTERDGVRPKRRKRKGRSRTVSTTSQSSLRRRTRLNSTDSYMTSGDESSLLSPPLPPAVEHRPVDQSEALKSLQPQSIDPINDEHLSPIRDSTKLALNSSGSQTSDMSSPGQVNAAAGLLLALANGGAPQNISDQQLKSPENDGNNSSASNSSLQSSPGTPLSSACYLVAAAVGPLEPGFKFPKTKKAIMNEWLNKSPEIIPTDPITETNNLQQNNQSFDIYTTNTCTSTMSSPTVAAASNNNKGLATLVQAASLCDSPPQQVQQSFGKTAANNQSGGGGNAKKRWLRQAISEECDSPCSRAESPSPLLGNQEMVAPPKKRRLVRESLSSEQSFTPPTTPTMLVPPSNALLLDDENFANNDEEFYETPSNGSPSVNVDDSIKNRGLGIIVYDSSNITNTSTTTSSSGSIVYHRHDHELNDADDISVVKDQLEFTTVGIEAKRETSLPAMLDPRLGRDPRPPIFRDSAQLLGTVEKTIRFYEENLTGPVAAPVPQIDSLLSPGHQVEKPQMIIQQDIVEEPLPQPPPSPEPVYQVVPPPRPVTPPPSDIKDKSVPSQQPKPEIITPAKRKLSISEYRQRKQLKLPDRNGSPNPDRVASPETPPLAPSPAHCVCSPIVSTTIATARPRPRSRSASSSSTTSSLSSDEELVVGATSNVAASGLDNNNVVEGTKTTTVVEPIVAVAFNSAPTAVERQRENVERLKKAFGLSLDDETRRINNPISRDKHTQSPKTIILTTEASKVIDSNKFTLSDTTFTSTCAKRLSLEKSSENLATDAATASSLEEPEITATVKPIATRDSKPEESPTNNKETNIDYPQFEESTSFIPPFNNPVYPNSTQFTSFASVIDSSPYEGRNPSPPPAEMLKSSKLMTTITTATTTTAATTTAISTKNNTPPVMTLMMSPTVGFNK